MESTIFWSLEDTGFLKNPPAAFWQQFGKGFNGSYGMERIVSAYLDKGGMLTAQPYHVTHKPYEQLSAFFNIVLMAGINAFTPLGERLTTGLQEDCHDVAFSSACVRPGVDLERMQKIKANLTEESE